MVDQAWFEMVAIRRRRLANAVWIPLRVAEWVEEDGQLGCEGYRKEFFGLGSLAVPLGKRLEAGRLGWSEIGLGHSQGVYASKDIYIPAEVYQYNEGDDLGVELVLDQSFDGCAAEPVWHLNQDLMMALGLSREGDEWIRPNENYSVVARLRRNQKDHPIALEIKNEFLRDYLAARSMSLRVTSYREREWIVDNAEIIEWPEGGVEEKSEHDHFRAQVIAMLEGYRPVDAGFAVFRISRTDVDADDDVPLPGPETDANTASESRTGVHKGKVLFRILGELWRNEWIEPATSSVRVRGDKIPTGIQYIVDASGERASSENLKVDDNPRWLWFRPEAVLSLIRRRGGELEWYMRDTGAVSCSPGYSVHFGVNGTGLVTVFASDVASLPAWQQQIWAGFNAAPEGGVSRELLSAQMGTRVADTTAPETILPEIMNALDEAFSNRIGGPLFRGHPSTKELISAAHRFRAVEGGGFLALAKDLVRLTADRIDASALQKVVPPPGKEKWGSLKLLEKYLGTVLPEDNARSLISPLVGAYQLRIGDAHLPSSDLEEAYRLVQVDRGATRIKQGFQLVASVVSTLVQIERVLHA
jgi:hypothetical protein